MNALPSQQPVYKDPGALKAAQKELGKRVKNTPFIYEKEIKDLQYDMARVCEGEAFLLQLGPCSERLSETNNETPATLEALIDAKHAIHRQTQLPVISILRGAGQFFKPRSELTETRLGIRLPAFRGEGINSNIFTLKNREYDPRRLMKSYDRSAEVMDLIRSTPQKIYASHEALLLAYECPLVGKDNFSRSGHMLWIGDRTREPDGAVVDFLSKVKNPIGMKCGPTLELDTLKALIEKLNPENKTGRLTLIMRMGAAEITKKLPPIIKAVQETGIKVIYSVDPMHGNTRKLATGIKTRYLGDILEETRLFFAICHACGVVPGGLHLEASGLGGNQVAECVDNSITEQDIKRSPLCDARLNREQLQLVVQVAARGLRDYRAAIKPPAPL